MTRALIACWGLITTVSFAATPVPPGTAGQLIQHYHMQPIPAEGPWFGLTYTSEDELNGDDLPARYAQRSHSAGSAIVALETPRAFSALHRLKTDEVWHFYDGAPIDMLLLYPDGHGRKVTLGAHVLAGEWRQFTVPHGVWQGSAPRGSSAGTYSLFADQLSPGFQTTDFEMGYRDSLTRQYPTFAGDIEKLTRPEFASAPSTTAQADDSSPRASFVAPADVPINTLSPGVTLQELVGLQAPWARTSRLSVARFTLAGGGTSGRSYNLRSQEVLLVESGSGYVTTAESRTAVGPGSSVLIPARVPHSIEADREGVLIFYAISAPAFTPEDYVAEKP